MSQISRSQGKALYKILGFLAGIMFLVAGNNERADINHVKKFGRPAIVEPIANYQKFKSLGVSTYTAEFHFKTDDGRDIIKKHSFPEELIADFNAGTPVRVLYMPNDPYTFVFEKDSPSWLPMIFGGFLAVAALILA